MEMIILIKIQLKIPHDVKISKNRAFGVMNGRIYSTGSKKKILQNIERITLKAVSEAGVQFAKEKIWLKIHVEKPHHRSDAINVIDTLCDGIKKGLGVDDKWFCISNLDWSIVKDRMPMITVEISQG